MDSRGRPAAAGELMAQDYRYIPLPASAPPGGYRATAARREQARLQRAREAAWRRESEGLGVPVTEPGVLAESTGRRERPPTSWEMVGGPTIARAGGALVEALDAPPSGMRETVRRHPDMPYTTPLRMLNATTAVIPKTAGTALSTLRGTPLSETTIDPMAPVDEQTNWVSELQHQGVPDAWAVGLGTTADFLLDPMDWATGGAAGLATLPATLARIPKALRGGFMSRVDDAIDLIPVKGAHPNKVASLLSRASKEELEYRGVPAFLAAQGNTPVTREAMLAHLEANPAPMPVSKTLGERRLGNQEAAEALSNGERVTWMGRGGLNEVEVHDPATILSNQSGYADDVANGEAYWRVGDSASTPKYSQYQVPGGTNYRETVLLLPNERLERAGQALEEFEQRLLADVPITTRWSIIREDGSAAPSYHTRQAAEDARWNPAQRIEETPTRVSPQLPAQGTPLRDEYERLRDAVAAAKRGDQYQYQSPHFDEPNVLVHTRSNERTLPTGERGRFLEEVQSDWHQTGKEKGYATANPTISDAKRFFGISDEKWGAMDDVARETYLEELITWKQNTGFVPDAPFKDSWQDLGFKQQLLEVSDDPTLDWIGWTSGKTQAARYDLSEKIGQITARPTPDGLVHLEALTPDMGTVVMNKVVSPDELDGIIGKEISEKIRAGIRFQTSPSDRGVPVELTGLDLQVGGEGMVEFYDRLLPKRVAKIVKPFGGIVEQVSMGAGQPDQWIVRLTPEMKAKIKQGLPLLALPAGVRVADESRERRRN